MQHAPTRRPRRARTLLVLLAFVLAALTVAAAPALAANAGPTLGLTGLQAKLAAGDPVPAYMKTVLKGTTVTDIPVRVLAIVDSSTWGKLIMFDSTDARITDIGGIAAGMSGSPIYVNDGGQDKMIGAVSWGAEFSLGGTGLATPIEDMTAVQDHYGAVGSALTPAARATTGAARTTVPLSAPVGTSAGTVKSLVLAKNAKTAAAVAPVVGQTVMHPLALAEIGGIPAGSKAYKTLAAKLEATGLTVIPAQTSPSAGGPATPDFAAGSACAVLFSRGFWWMGVLGTVTYVDGDSVMMFGHPILGDPFALDLGTGTMEGILTGATVGGIWPSSSDPEKMMTPADVKGTATQDRSTGVLGTIGTTADLFPVTTDTSVDGGAQHVVDSTDVGEWFGSVFWPGSVDSFGMNDPGTTGSVVAGGFYHALDSDALAGSAETTTTVHVTDASGSTTISRDNIWDADGSETALADTAAGDATDIVSSVVNDQFGLRHVHIDSVSVTATLSSARRSGSLVDAQLEAPLKVGDNVIDITYYRWGSAELQTLKATLTLPAGTDLDGELDVTSAASAAEMSYFMGSSSSASVPETLAQVKAQLEAAPTNDDLVVGFTPRSAMDDYEGDGYPPAAASVNVPTGWVLSGSIAKRTTQIQLRAPSTVGLGSPMTLSGYLPSASASVPLSVYVYTAGTSQPSTPTMTLVAKYDGDMASFNTVLPPATHDQVVTVTAPALSSSGLPGSASSTIVVRAQLSLGVKRSHGKWSLTARVTPPGSGGSVEFQRRVHGRWATLATVPVTKNGAARVTLAGKKPAGVRARFTGSTLNGATAWVKSR
jgi:hypothetical protein